MLPELDGYDWEEAFAYSSGKESYGSSDTPTVPKFAEAVPETPVTREDVAEILAIREGENDGPNWLLFAKLNDGRYFFLDAGCDYTGWDCQAGGTSYVTKTAADMIRWGMGEYEREALGLKLEENADSN